MRRPSSLPHPQSLVEQGLDRLGDLIHLEPEGVCERREWGGSGEGGSGRRIKGRPGGREENEAKEGSIRYAHSVLRGGRDSSFDVRIGGRVQAKGKKGGSQGVKSYFSLSWGFMM
jgi:hypothetical protein